MSELHKSFIKNIKQREQAFGLSSLSEEPTNNELTVSESPIIEQDEAQDSKILSIYNQFKSNTFPIIESYKDPVTELELKTYYRPPSSSNTPIFICHHGAGSSSMTFGKLAETLIETYGTANDYPGIFVFDARGHGSSSTSKDYSLEALTNDFKFVVTRFNLLHKPENSIYLLGHSLGGSVLTNYLLKNPDNKFNFKGLIMLDIVEETAIKSLNTMPSFISKRPTSFNSFKDSIDWHIKQTQLLYNFESAIISIPDLLTRSSSGKIEWKTDLRLTESFWATWFKDLSNNFINSGRSQKIAKLLILAGNEVLDTNLIIGQMQGKYQLIVFNNNERTGHFIHEDIPKQVSLSLIDFVRRNDSPADYMKKELGFTPKWGGQIHS